MEKLKLAIIIGIFGTIGVISVFIPLSSASIVFYRSIIAAVFLYCLTFITKRKLDFNTIKKEIFLIVLISIALAVNWILQFESFRVSSVSIGTVCYNTMPIFVIILAPIMFKEKLSIKNIICIIMAMFGVVLVSNFLLNGFSTKETIGCIYGILAAICYALVVMMNKKLEHVPAYEKVTTQFFIAALVVIPYIFLIDKNNLHFYENITQQEFITGIILLLILSIVHTGLAYAVYFDTITKVDATTIAILTYIDPLVALLLSHFILKESLNNLQIIGAILILLSTLINEFIPIKKK